MLNLYAITRDQVQPTRYFEYAATPFEAVQQWRKYWNRPNEPVKFKLVQSNVQKLFQEEHCA